MANGKISMTVIRRLPKYHRYLKDLLEKGINRISSKELSEIIGFTASQIRQDLNNFGGFGQQGYGYNVEDLYSEIGTILGLGKPYKTVIIGAGNLGQALANYNFESHGFELVGMYDVDEALIGKKIKGIEIKPSDRLVEDCVIHQVDIAYLCTNRESAQNVANALVKCGVRAIWNFTPVDLKVPEETTIVEDVHLIDSLLTISYFLKDH
ncbi:MAG: REX family transcriptional regulator [delta proteobacterium ML8_F1]|nr:MAG: REX family transcriptional regulator [delta proteobacterium ML8_F1]